ncbi:hypothetical protein MTO96_015027 [Rhipicephalus appendiculatus]
MKNELGPFHVGILDNIGELSFSTTFYKPPPAAAAICSSTRPDGSCNFDVYGFLQSSYHSDFSKDFEAFRQHWNIDYSMTDTAKMTLLQDYEILPDDLLERNMPN